MGQITIDQLNRQTCPICGKTVDEVRHWVSCPKHQAPVCMDHCYKGCWYLSTSTHCSYRERTMIKKKKHITAKK